MVDINLLPWRVYLKEHNTSKNRNNTIILIISLLIIWVSFSFEINHRCQKENQTIQQLKKQLVNLDILNKKNSIDSEYRAENISTTFQQNRTQIIYFFHKIMELTSEDIQWENILSQNDQIILTGKASSYQSLIRFIQLFGSRKNEFQMDLIKLKRLPNNNRLQFSLQINHVLYTLPDFIEGMHVA